MFVDMSFEEMCGEAQINGVYYDYSFVPINLKDPEKGEMSGIKIIYPGKNYLSMVSGIIGKYSIVAVREAILNAIRWGNKADPTMQVNLEIFEGLDSKVLQISDFGEGFDYKDLINKQRTRIKYFQNTGNGLQRFVNDRHYKVSYADSGSTINFLIPNVLLSYLE
ncbi:ATP-binding protein [Candidatus Woesearchaeota archaeon]|nr:ATP-binding protein [Candidatus Woesearchaeota archaeon]